MTEGVLAGLTLAFIVLLGLGFVGVSARYRFTSRTVFRSRAIDEVANDRWRFGFFVVWTLLLPLALLVEVHCPPGFWPKPPDSLTLDFTYKRKVISDVWTAVAVVLAALAWNKPPQLITGVGMGQPADSQSGTDETREDRRAEG